jgi:hypothetical protein
MKPLEESHPEPEIIPPGDAHRRSGRAAYRFGGAYPYVEVRGSHRVYAARLGPFGIFVVALVIALAAAVMLVVLLGAILIWIPLIVLLVAAAVISALLRRR